MIRTAIVYFLVDYCIDRFGSMLESVFTPVSPENVYVGKRFRQGMMLMNGVHITLYDVIIQEPDSGDGLVTFTCSSLYASLANDSTDAQDYLRGFKKFLELDGYPVHCVNTIYGIKALSCNVSSTHTLSIGEIEFYD